MVSHQTGMALPQSSRAVAAVFESIELGLACGEEVMIRRFGRFYPMTFPLANRPHPGTGEYRDVPASLTVRFSPSVTLRRRMNR